MWGYWYLSLIQSLVLGPGPVPLTACPLMRFSLALTIEEILDFMICQFLQLWQLEIVSQCKQWQKQT